MQKKTNIAKQERIYKKKAHEYYYYGEIPNKMIYKRHKKDMNRRLRHHVKQKIKQRCY